MKKKFFCSFVFILSLWGNKIGAQTLLNGNPLYFFGADLNYSIQSGAWNDGAKYKHWTSHQFYTQGIQRLKVESNGGTNLLGNALYFLGGPGDPNYSIQSGAFNDGMKYRHWTSHQFFTTGVERIRVENGGLNTLGNAIYFLGGAADPNYSIQSGAFNDGMKYRHWTSHQFFTTGVERFRVDADGTVKVVNTLLAGRIKVAVPGSANWTAGNSPNSKNNWQWADYVFDEQYPLKPLEEVEAFIKQNKHLPNIPSTEEVKKDGIDLGQMNAKLLEKIEELTLYMIELKKENKEQQKEINTLKLKLNNN